MHSSNYWIKHFKANALQKRINWAQEPNISTDEIETILHSLQAWQLGETSEGKQLIAAAEKYAAKIEEPEYVEAIRLFIKEEQKHGNNLGAYLDNIGKERIKQNWGDTLFRKVRHLNTSMESWTIAVIVVESTAQIFYQSLKDATECGLLKEICTDILIDEAHHITFQTERLAAIYHSKSAYAKSWRKIVYKYFFIGTSLLVWFANKRLFKAGDNTFECYMNKMELKYSKTIKKITKPYTFQIA
ncbi:ferritin-like domain-containing protein [Mucilaginibacter sp.]|uniref:ferritin-like domain-containing protein n=1 Tax=Mucilaginibacter sp. TaxID=1882438 RepID=UPI003D09C467